MQSVDPAMAKPQLALILHAHLPWVRHPEASQFHEETWFFEALSECYLPLCGLMAAWTQLQRPWRLALTVSPTLAAQLRDPLLCARFERHLQGLQLLAQSEVERNHLQPELRTVAEFYVRRFEVLLTLWKALGGDVLASWAFHAAAGNLELLTCAATHSLLPLLAKSPIALNAQIAVAVSEHRRNFGLEPTGFWLPECGYTPEVEPALLAHGLKWTVLETHGLMHATPRPQLAIFAPALTSGGLAVFARDPASARQVWSRQGGYPGDPRYREFHRDLADDAEWDYIRPWLTGGDLRRTSTGIKYHAVTGSTETKQIYSRSAALGAAREHAAHFLGERVRWAAEAGPLPGGRPALCVAPYDAELFGHWWFEGPEFLDELVRLTTAPDSPLELVTPSEHLEQYPHCEIVQPAASSWGEGGHFGVWLDVRNAWMQTPLRSAETALEELAERFAHGRRPRLKSGVNAERALQQAARELLLAQASDWPFLLRHGTAGDYPRHRFTDHLAAFHQLVGQLEGVRPWDDAFVAEREFRHPIFPHLDWHLWAKS